MRLAHRVERFKLFEHLELLNFLFVKELKNLGAPHNGASFFPFIHTVLIKTRYCYIEYTLHLRTLKN